MSSQITVTLNNNENNNRYVTLFIVKVRVNFTNVQYTFFFFITRRNHIKIYLFLTQKNYITLNIVQQVYNAIKIIQLQFLNMCCECRSQNAVKMLAYAKLFMFIKL